MNEAQVRELLIEYLKKKHPKEQEIAFIKELFINDFGQRADLVMANGKLSSFEIKSELDNLNRLPQQIESYLNHFEEITVVCSEKHKEGVLEMIENKNVGLMTLSVRGKLKTERAPKKIKLDSTSWLSHLPVDEVKLLLRENGLPLTGHREALVDRVNTQIALKKVRSYVLAYFKRREYRIEQIKKKLYEKNQIAGVCENQSTSDLPRSINRLIGSNSYVIPRATKQNPHPRHHPLRILSDSKVELYNQFAEISAD